jgi:hypothetical protein
MGRTKKRQTRGKDGEKGRGGNRYAEENKEVE